MSNLDKTSLAWEHDVPDQATRLYRVLHYREFNDRRLRCSNFYATREAADKAIAQIVPEDLISVTTFDFTAVVAGRGGVDAPPSAEQKS